MADVGFGVQPLLQVGADFQPAGGDEVADADDALLCGVGLRHGGGGAAHLPGGFLPQPADFGAPQRARRRQVFAQSVVVVDGGGNVLQHTPVGAPHQDSDVRQPGKFMRHRSKAGHKKVADRNVGRLGLGQNGLEIIRKSRVAGSVEDVHCNTPGCSPAARAVGDEKKDRLTRP